MSAPSVGVGGGGGGGGGDNKFGNTYGLSTQFLESLGINGPLVTRVFVANVSTSVQRSASNLGIVTSINARLVRAVGLQGRREETARGLQVGG